MIDVALLVSIVATTAGLSAAFLSNELWVPGALILLMGGVWIGAQRARVRWISWVVMGFSTVAAAVGAWLGLHPALLLVGFTGALSAWDLERFRRELGDVAVVERRAILSRRHLARVLLVDGIGLAAAWAALGLRIELTFAVAVLLGLVALIGLNRVVVLLRNEENG